VTRTSTIAPAPRRDRRPTGGILVGSGAFSASARGAAPSAVSDRRRRRRDPKRPRRGLALVLSMTAVAILATLLADMHENTGTAFAVAVNARDRLQAEYVAKSGLDLTRLLVGQEPQLRALVNPFYQVVFGRPPPMLPVWTIADDVIIPFCDPERAEAAGATAGLSFRRSEGLEPLPGTCEILSFAENAKLNLNDPLNLDGDQAKKNVATQLYALMGGYLGENDPYAPLFSGRDPDGNFTDRQTVVTALIDWWDPDTNRTAFDPGALEVSSAGSEEDVYQTFDDPYRIKNAPFDSLEEMRLVRGMGDDVWSTFIEPNPEDPTSRKVTIYGSGSVNPNEAPPEVLLARLCSYVDDQPLCTDPLEAAKFINLLNTARALFPIPFFTRVNDFLTFLEGGGGPRDLYPMLQGLLGEGHPLLFTPLQLPQEQRTEIDNRFVTAARILTIQSTGVVGRTRVRIQAVVNFHDRWTPPPPNAGRLPSLGVFHHYRVD